jgi:tetratricopeptide (TPR) repeat protein
MPKRAVDRISHSALTNHRIPVRAGAPAASIVTRGGLAGLRIVNADDSGAQLPLVTRLAAYGEIMARAPALVSFYAALLDEASRSEPEDPVVLAALAHKALLENKPDAASKLNKAIAQGAPGAILHIDLGQALEKDGRLDESVSALERGEELFLFSQEIRKRLVLGYIRQKSYAKAKSAMERYVVDFPEDDFMRSLLRQVSEQRRQ